MELEDEGAPISVTLIKPGPIDAPFPEHAKNYLPDQPKHAPPVYAPESVAEAILHAATTPVRDIYVGSAAKAASTMNKWTPGLMDTLVPRMLIPGTHSGQPPRGRDALREAGDGMRERGDYPGLVRPSLYTRAVTHPVATGVATLGVGVLAAVLWRSQISANGRH